MDSILPSSQAKRRLCRKDSMPKQLRQHHNRSSEKQRKNSITICTSTTGRLSSEQHRAMALMKHARLCLCCVLLLQQPDYAWMWMRAVPEFNGCISLCIFLEERNFTCQLPHQFFQRGWVVGVVAFLLSVEINKAGTHHTACVAWTGMEWNTMHFEKFGKCLLTLFENTCHPRDQFFLSV
jgi:hypothetical protein